MEDLITVNKRWRWVITYAGLFYEDYLSYLPKEGYRLRPYENMMLEELQMILATNDIIRLNHKQYAFLFLLLDFVCIRALEEGHPPYNENELRMFKDAQTFMDRFKTFEDIGENWRYNKYEKVLVHVR